MFLSLEDTLKKKCHAFIVLDDTIDYFLLLVYLPCYRDYAKSKLLKYVLVNHTIVIVEAIHRSNITASTVLSRFLDNWPHEILFLEPFYFLYEELYIKMQ